MFLRKADLFIYHRWSQNSISEGSGRFQEDLPEGVRTMVTEFEFRKVPEGFRKAGPEDFYTLSNNSTVFKRTSTLVNQNLYLNACKSKFVALGIDPSDFSHIPSVYLSVSGFSINVLYFGELVNSFNLFVY